MLRIALIIGIILNSMWLGIIIGATAAKADTQCYMVNGKFTCCTRVGNYTSCT